MQLKLNIPPFANAGLGMTQADELLTKKIAAHRVHVERTIGSVKKFKIVGQKVPLSLFGRVNQIWNVCCFLTTFQKPIIRRNNYMYFSSMNMSVSCSFFQLNENLANSFFIIEGDRTFIRTPGSDVFKLGISGLVLSGSGNYFYEFQDVGI